MTALSIVVLYIDHPKYAFDLGVRYTVYTNVDMRDSVNMCGFMQYSCEHLLPCTGSKINQYAPLSQHSQPFAVHFFKARYPSSESNYVLLICKWQPVRRMFSG